MNHSRLDCDGLDCDGLCCTVLGCSGLECSRVDDDGTDCGWLGSDGLGGGDLVLRRVSPFVQRRPVLPRLRLRLPLPRRPPLLVLLPIVATAIPTANISSATSIAAAINTDTTGCDPRSLPCISFAVGWVGPGVPRCGRVLV